MGFQGSGFWVYGIEGLGLGAWGGGLGLKGSACKRIWGWFRAAGREAPKTLFFIKASTLAT